MTDFELLVVFLDGKKNFNFSAVESISFKKIRVKNLTFIFNSDGNYLKCIESKREG